MEKKASIIIPIFNQVHSLDIVIKAFYIQNVDSDLYEIIVVDDGSTDELGERKSDFYAERYDLDIKILKQPNKGRAAARNAGINVSKGEIIIFCDGDRFPSETFVQNHLWAHECGNEIVIGRSLDCFTKKIILSDDNVNWEGVLRFSRMPSYQKKVLEIYDEHGGSDSNLVWLSFLVGNSSVRKSVLQKVGEFSEEFKEWGFEHFEIAYRMYQNGFRFYYDEMCTNYHIPHHREVSFYSKMIAKSALQLSKMYPALNAEILVEFVGGTMGIVDAEDKLFISGR